jgi:hypothetical protein
VAVSDYLLTEEFNDDTIAVEISDAGSGVCVYGMQDFDTLVEFFRQLLEEGLNEYGHADRVEEVLKRFETDLRSLPPGDLDAFRAMVEEYLEQIEGSGFQIGRMCTIGELVEDAEFIEEVSELRRDAGFVSEEESDEDVESLDIARDAHLIYQALTQETEQT